MYEINLAEFHVDLDGAIERLDYLADLGVNCLSIMPVSNVASEVDWGYLPVGYFGVDERFGGNDKFKTFVDAAHARELAVIVDAVYGHASRALFAYQYLYDQLRYDQNPFMGSFAQDLFASQGASTDYSRQLTQDFFLAVNLHWLEELPHRRISLRLRAQLLGWSHRSGLRQARVPDTQPGRETGRQRRAASIRYRRIP